MAKRVWSVVLPMLALTACSGDDDDAGSAADWCTIARQVAGADLAAAAIGDDPASARAAFADLRVLFDRAADAAPDEIHADVDTVAEGVGRIAQIADGVDYDLAAADEAAMGEIDQTAAELGDASARIAAYTERECGIAAPASATGEAPTTAGPATSTSTSTAPFVPGSTESGSGPVFTGDPDSAWCGLARKLEQRDDDLESALLGEPAEVERYIAEYLAEVEAAVDVAPPEIADDVATFVDGVRALDAAFAAAGYDLLRVDLSVISDLDAEMNAVSETIEQYDSDVCGIERDESSDDSSDIDPTAGSIRDQVIGELVELGMTQEQAGCVFDAIDFTDPNVGDDLGAMLDVFEQCGVDPTELVPGE